MKKGLPSRYNYDNFKRSLRNPQLIIEEINRVVSRPIGSALGYLTDQYFSLKFESGKDVMSADWDNLILLDACRYDFFAEENTIQGDLNRVISKGSRSWEFMKGNFVGRELHDTVYITANPHVGRLEKDIFHTIIPLLEKWKERP